MPIIHIKQIRDLHGEGKKVTRSESCLRLVLTCVFSIMLRTDRASWEFVWRPPDQLESTPSSGVKVGCAHKGNAMLLLSHMAWDILNTASAYNLDQVLGGN